MCKLYITVCSKLFPVFDEDMIVIIVYICITCAWLAALVSFKV